MREEIKGLSSFALTGDVIERQFYMVIWEHKYLDVETELLKRASTLEERFSSCELQAEIADQNTIVRLCNLFANPAFAHIEGTDIGQNIPLIYCIWRNYEY